MDAVRWVLGESRASELRGESMQDVIFNGTTTRKQASRSSVELVFDNADHRAGGQWAQFAEIAVKRVLTRDGNSSYYINNQPVRRRDVQDVFLGTGLGPRAYAIIGQGTISRIIESKPEELRLFLEEAAGVSKYKERRRETENRLGDTRENLTRVEDILRELNTNLDKLEKQAEVAHALQHAAGRRHAQAAPAVVPQAQPRARPTRPRSRPMPRRPINDLESRTADLRHVESRARNRAPGALRGRRPGQPGAGQALRGQRRSRPARRRDPLRGRRPPARRAAPGAAAASRSRNGPRASEDAEAEIENAGRRRAWMPRSRPSCWPRSSKSTTRSMPEPRRGAAAARRTRPTRSAPASRRCSSRSRCWPPTSATSRSRSAS